MSLLIRKTGMRLPFQGWSDDRSLKENMRFVERQLEDYLHEHTSTEGGDTVTVPDDFDIEFWESGSMPVGHDLLIDMGGSGEDPAANKWHKSSTDPRSGSFVLRIEADTTFSNPGFVYVANPDPDIALSVPWAIWLDAGDTVTASCWAKTNATSGESFFDIATLAMEVYDMGGGFLTSLQDTIEDGPFDWTQLQLSYESAVAARAFVSIQSGFATDEIEGDEYVNIDDIVVTTGGAAGLRLRKTGFRFPRQDFAGPGAMKENMMFAQTQIEKYLHEHKVVS